MQLLGFFTTNARLSPHASSQGFTLVELVLSLALLGLIASWAAPNWQRLQERNRVEAARDQLVNDL